MSTALEYLRHACLFIMASYVYSLPSSYLSSMTGSDGGMTWMGWAPQTGMTAFASSNNPWAVDKGWKNTGIELQPPAEDSHNNQEERTPPNNNRPRFEEDEYRPSSSKAEASLNAWFPIMLGLFPPQGESDRNRQQEPSWENAKSITALANSVNHGSRGVSSSHAVAYGGEPPNYRSRTSNASSDPKQKTNRDQPAPAPAQPQGKAQQYYKQLQRYANTSY